MSGRHFSCDSTVSSSGATSVTPSDTENLPNVTNRVYVGTGGTMRVTFARQADGEFINFANLPAGAVLEIQVKRIWATGTGATGINALYP